MTSPTVLVTGATDGIGRATAHAVAARGARVQAQERLWELSEQPLGAAL